MASPTIVFKYVEDTSTGGKSLFYNRKELGLRFTKAFYNINFCTIRIGKGG